MIIRSVGGRTGPLALENGAKLTFPWARQQRIVGTFPGTMLAYDEAGFEALSLEGPTLNAVADRSYIDLRGSTGGVGSVLIGNGVANNYMEVSADINLVRTSGTNVNLLRLNGVSRLSATNGTNAAVLELFVDGSATFDAGSLVFNASGINVLGQWTAYTPTLKQNGAAINKTVTYSRHMKIGRTVIFQCYLAATAAGTANTMVTVTLPATGVTAYNGGPISGTFYVYDASAGSNYLGHVMIVNSATEVAGLIHAQSGYMGTATGGFTAALASGDSILVSCIYEAAT